MEETPEKQSPVSPAPTAPAQDPKNARPESRMNRFLLKAFRLSVGFLIIFGLGILAATMVLYTPATRKLNAAIQDAQRLQEQAKSDVEQANQQVGELQSKVDTLTALDIKNEALQDELRQAQLHIVILSARSDVAAAQLGLARTNPTAARVALSKTGETLETLAGLLDPTQRKVATDMQERLALALKGIGVNANAAESDLVVLATDLLELENAYFAKP